MGLSVRDRAARSARSLASEAKFRARLAELGAELLEPRWLGANTPHRVRCPAGHECAPYPGNVVKGCGVCRSCGGAAAAVTRMATTEARFRARLAELGAVLLEPYRGVVLPHRVRCAAGHECAPRPHDVINRGRGVCRSCGVLISAAAARAGRTAAAEARFRARLAELGAVLLEPRWLGARTKYRVRCADNHESALRPDNINRSGVCRVCSGLAAIAAREARRRERQAPVEARRRERLAARAARQAAAEKRRRDALAAAEKRRRERQAAAEKRRRDALAARQAAAEERRRERLAAAEARFRARLAELGAELLEPRWLGARTKHRVRCAAGHKCTPLPSYVNGGGGICRACAGAGLPEAAERQAPTGARRRSPAAAEARFRARLAELGAELLEPYHGSGEPHRVRCAAGHDVAPRPGDVIRGHGVCRSCAGAADPEIVRRKAAAAAAFRARLAELGAELLDTEWRGVMAKYHVRCAAGHDCYPLPNGVQQGQGICLHCAGMDPMAAEARFRARLAELGAELLEPYHGSSRPHRVRCRAGHECTPSPAFVTRGGGICKQCAGTSWGASEARFRARLAELGAELLEPRWLGAKTPHRVRCAAGHEVTPTPGSVLRRGGVCRMCADQNNQVTAAVRSAAGVKFRAILAAAGAELLEPYRGRHYPHRVRCSAGHEVMPTPGRIMSGTGICRMCAGRAWDAFYVVADRAAGRIKFGITSGDPRDRLSVWRGQGYREVVRQVTGLPGTVAPEIESACLAAVALAGFRPIRGREFYDADALAVVLDVADHWPIPSAEAGAAALPAKPRPGRAYTRPSQLAHNRRRP